MIASARRRQRRRPWRQRRAALHSVCRQGLPTSQAGVQPPAGAAQTRASQERLPQFTKQVTLALRSPPPLGRNEETAIDALRQLKIRPSHFYCQQNANTHMDTCTHLPDCNRSRQMLQNGNGGKGAQVKISNGTIFECHQSRKIDDL